MIKSITHCIKIETIQSMHTAMIKLDNKKIYNHILKEAILKKILKHRELEIRKILTIIMTIDNL